MYNLFGTLNNLKFDLRFNLDIINWKPKTFRIIKIKNLKPNHKFISKIRKTTQRESFSRIENKLWLNLKKGTLKEILKEPYIYDNMNKWKKILRGESPLSIWLVLTHIPWMQ